MMRGAAGAGLRLGDPGHRRADDPGHVQARLLVEQPHGHHGPEEVEGLDVHFGEDRVGRRRRPGTRGPARCGWPPRGGCRCARPPRCGVMRSFRRHQHAVDHQQVDGVVGHRPGDLLLGGAEVEQHGAHPGQGLGPPLVVRPGPWVRAVELDDARAGGGAVVVLAAPGQPWLIPASPGTRSWPVAPSGRRSPRPGSAPRRAGRRPGGRSAPPHRRRRPAPPSVWPS